MPDIVITWTGWHANALRQALRMTNEEFAEHLNVAVRTVAYWRARPELVPRQGMQQILDVALDRAPETSRAHFQRLVAEHGSAEMRTAPMAVFTGPAGLTEWLTATGTSDGAIEGMDRAAAALAEAHTHTPAGVLLADARQVQARVQQLLADGRLRHRQERELLRVNGDVLAHMSLLLSDLHASKPANDYGNAALLYLREAGASEAAAWYVLAKNARWRHQYVRAADLACQGLQRRAYPAPMTVQLACYEANASALAGDASRARAAMRRAEENAAELPVPEVSSSPWSFPSERMTIFRLSVALHTGDLDGALLAASDVSPAWSNGPHVPAAWAQIRIGAGIACVLRDEPDGAGEWARPVLDLPRGLRIATVTGWLADLDRHLANDRFARVPAVVELRQQIREFTTTALGTHEAGGEEDST